MKVSKTLLHEESKKLEIPMAKDTPDKNEAAHVSKVAATENEDYCSGNSAYTATFDNEEEKSCGWLIDSGASSHMALDRTIFANFDGEKTETNIVLVDRRKVEVSGRGDIKRNTVMTDRSMKTSTIKGVLQVHELSYYILSVGAMMSSEKEVNFKQQDHSLHSVTEKCLDKSRMMGIQKQNGIYGSKRCNVRNKTFKDYNIRKVKFNRKKQRWKFNKWKNENAIICLRILGSNGIY